MRKVISIKRREEGENGSGSKSSSVLPGRGVPSGESHAGKVYVDTHALSTRIEYDPVVSKRPPDLYPSRFKGPIMSVEIEVLTATLDSFWLILF